MFSTRTVVYSIIFCLCLFGLAWSIDNVELGNEAFARGDFDRAVEYYRKAIDDEPTFAAYVNLGHCYMRLEQWTEATSSYEAAVGLEGRSVTAEIWRLLGQARFQSHKYEQAMDVFFKASSLEPGNSEDTISIARCMIELEQWIQAQSVLYGQLQREPKNTTALELLGYVFEQQDYWPGVIAVYRELLDIVPERTAYRIALAKSLTIQGHNQQAIDILEFTWRIDRSLSEQSNRLLADLYMAEEMPQEAAACYVRLVNVLHSLSSEDYYRLGMAYLQTKELSSAENAFLKLQQAEPANYKADLYLGHVAFEKGNLDKAQLHYNSAVEKNPSSVESVLSLANIQMKSKIYVDASNNFAKAIKLGDNRPQVYYNYISALMNGNDKKRIIAAFKEALAEHPSDTQLIRLLNQYVQQIIYER